MTVDELNTKIKDARIKLKANAGKAQFTGENGPIGIGFIEAVATILESQQKQIDELQKSLAELQKKG